MKERYVLWVVLCLLAGINNAFAEEIAESKEVSTGQEIVEKSAALIMRGNKIFTRVSLNGSEEFICCVDNGWSRTTFDPELLTGNGFKHEKTISYGFLDKSGERASEGTVEEMFIGDLRIDHPLVWNADIFGYLSRQLKYEIGGILGYTTLKEYLVTFDFKEKQIVFAEHNPASVAAIKEGNDVIALPFGRCLRPGPNDHIFSVRIKVNGKPVDAFIDLGFEGKILTTKIHRNMNQSIHNRTKRFPVKILGLSGFGCVAKADSVQLGDYKERSVKVIGFMCESAPDITIIGVEFIKNFKVTFDYKNKAVYLVKNR